MFCKEEAVYLEEEVRGGKDQLGLQLRQGLPGGRGEGGGGVVVMAVVVLVLPLFLCFSIGPPPSPPPLIIPLRLETS